MNHNASSFSSLHFPLFVFPDSINFNQHHVIEPKIVHARHRRAIENTREEVRKIFNFIFRIFCFVLRAPSFHFFWYSNWDRCNSMQSDIVQICFLFALMVFTCWSRWTLLIKDYLPVNSALHFQNWSSFCTFEVDDCDCKQCRVTQSLR